MAGICNSQTASPAVTTFLQGSSGIGVGGEWPSHSVGDVSSPSASTRSPSVTISCGERRADAGPTAEAAVLTSAGGLLIVCAWFCSPSVRWMIRATHWYDRSTKHSSSILLLVHLRLSECRHPRGSSSAHKRTIFCLVGSYNRAAGSLSVSHRSERRFTSTFVNNG